MLDILTLIVYKFYFFYNQLMRLASTPNFMPAIGLSEGSGWWVCGYVALGCLCNRVERLALL